MSVHTRFNGHKEFVTNNESSFLKASNLSWLHVLIYGWTNLTMISVKS